MPFIDSLSSDAEAGGLRERGGTAERGYAGGWTRPPDEQSVWYDGRIYTTLGMSSLAHGDCAAVLPCAARLCFASAHT